MVSFLGCSAYALGDIGSDAKSAVPALVEAMTRNYAVRKEAAWALKKIGGNLKKTVAPLENHPHLNPHSSNWYQTIEVEGI